MKAAVLEEYGKMVWKEVPTPEITGDEVLMKVRYACICGSDQHIFEGEFHPRTRLPLIQGHEFSAEIVETGPDVKIFRKGDRVAVDPIIWCGKCPACERHHYPACTTLKLMGVDLDGGFAEYVKAPEHMLFRITSDISDEQAALVEVLSIGFHACNRTSVETSDTLVIWGAGKVGQCILQAARTKTKNTLIMVDILDARLSRAKNAYPDIHVINAAQEDPVEKIRAITEGRGVDIAFEAVGHFQEITGKANPVRGCIQSIRGAGKVCVLGLSDEVTPVLFKELIWREATLIASRVTQGEFSETIENLQKGTLKPDALITDVFTADKAQEAFKMLRAEPEKHLKILLKL
jgi:2-desacetyl-2-hydroxyethyl bacteriochlorophyllide A dehydrogenase